MLYYFLTSFFHTMDIFIASSDNWQNSRLTIQRRVPKRNKLQVDCSILKIFTLFLNRIPRLFIPFSNKLFPILRLLDTSPVFIILKRVFIRGSSCCQGWSEIDTRGTDRGRKNQLVNAVPKTLLTELHLQDLDVSLGVIDERFKCETKLSHSFHKKSPFWLQMFIC